MLHRAAALAVFAFLGGACICSTAVAQYQVLESEPAALTAAYEWRAQKRNGRLTLSGNVPYHSVAELLLERAGENAVNEFEIQSGAPLGFLRDAMKAIDVLTELESGRASYFDGQWRIEGAAPSTADASEIAAAFSQPTGTGDPWIVDLNVSPERAPSTSEAEPEEGGGSEDSKPTAGTSDLAARVDAALEGQASEEPDSEAPQSGTDESVLLPTEVEDIITDMAPSESSETAIEDAMMEETEVEPMAGASAPPEAHSLTIDECRAQTESILADNPIQFASGTAQLSENARAIVAELATIFEDCQALPVYVEGHTDAVGDAQANLKLSLSRAETVVNTLVEAGISPSRVYAVGYGASLPIASNDTVQGRTQNRRIVFSFRDIADIGGINS